MNNSEETFEQSTLENEDSPILKAIAGLSNKIDSLEQITNTQFEAINKKLSAYDTQFEAIRIGLVANSAAFDRLEAKVLLLRADVKDLTEEIRQTRKAITRETLELKN
jgi:predicted  nucleic acid-binding Zn-ribbon protein